MESSKKKRNIDDLIKSSLQKLKILEKTEFFVAYMKFECIFKEFKKKYIRHADMMSDYIDDAAKSYFSKVFDGKSNIEIKFQGKSLPGAQVSSILLNITGVFKILL